MRHTKDADTSFTELANGRIVLELWPARGTPILFYPGSMLEPGHYRLFLNELSAAGFSVCGLHLPGHGRNDSGLKTFGELLALGGMAEEWLERHYRGRVALCGHSQGGILAMAHASGKSNACACFSICSVYPEMAEAIEITRFRPFARHGAKIRAFFRKLAQIAPDLPVPLPLYLSPCRLLAGRKFPLFYGKGKGSSFYSARFLDSLFSADIKFPQERPFWLLSAKNDGLFSEDLARAVFERAKPPAGKIIWLDNGGHLAIFNPKIAAFTARACAAIMSGRGHFLDLKQREE